MAVAGDTGPGVGVVVGGSDAPAAFMAMLKSSALIRTMPLPKWWPLLVADDGICAQTVEIGTGSSHGFASLKATPSGQPPPPPGVWSSASSGVNWRTPEFRVA